MTETSQKIMELFKGHEKVKTGLVLGRSELLSHARRWGGPHAEKLKEAAEELSREGYVIITPTDGVELTDEGYEYLFGEVSG